MKRGLFLSFLFIFSLMFASFAFVADSEASANPFSDVPAGHWAYDAVAQLAAYGVVSGYPDGSFKGAQAATRYEISSVVARAIAQIDEAKAPRNVVEALKKLIAEFKDELDALGVKVSHIEPRMDEISAGVGGWYFSGSFRFTADISGNDVSPYALGGDSRFRLDRFRWNIKKTVDENVTLFAVLQSSQTGLNGFNEADNFNLIRAYVEIKLPWSSRAYIGKQTFNWERDYTLMDYDGINSSQAVLTDYDMMNAFRWVKPVGEGGEFQAFVAHREGLTNPESNDMYRYGARLKWTFNEIAEADINYVKNTYTDSRRVVSNNDNATLWFGGQLHFNPAISLKGEYFWQRLDWAPYGTDDTPSAYKAIFSVKQDMLKFTSFWLEYAHFDQNFAVDLPVYFWGRNDDNNHLANGEFFRLNTNIWNIYLGQQWAPKWYSYVRYTKWDMGDGGGVDNWGISLRYQYTPSTSFELMYDAVSYDDTFKILRPNDNDHRLMFRTNVSF